MKQCQSTQEEIQKLISTDPNKNYLVSSDKQKLGRGQRDKKWFSTSCNLGFSFNLKSSNTLSLTSLEIGVLISKFFQEKYEISIDLKWPNDLYLNRKKCGGILIQKNQALICGIGINLFHDDELPKDIPIITTVFQAIVDNQQITKDLYNFIFNNRLSDDAIRNEFMNRCIHKNEIVTIIEDGNKVQGKFLDIGQHGEARVLINDEVKSIYSASLIIS